MVPLLRCPVHHQATRRARVASQLAIIALACLGAADRLSAQSPGAYYPHSSFSPPGAIGSAQLLRGGLVPGYFQPVEIRAPEGVRVSLVVDGAFADPQAAPVSVGLLIGAVYRVRVSNIPQEEGVEVFPTIEVIDRLYAPSGEARRFPIPIDVTEDDLRLALEGRFVTRVIYLEDPVDPLPIVEGSAEKNWFDVGPGANPIQEADRLGRPLAVLRMGGRVPDDSDVPDIHFLEGSPPFTVFRPWIEAEHVRAPASGKQPSQVWAARGRTKQ